ncbi:hypothetical protein RMCBS344292_10839 [Rhizopus microsporus]|nr:hypothetical protein RMCBS344292_10839 [Rhizopus microsporus]
METNEQQSSEFSGVIRNTKSFLSLIKCINIKNIATCYIYDEGMTLTVEESRCVKATAYFRRHMFQAYSKQANTEIPMFGLPLNALIDCFGLMVPHTSNSKSQVDNCEIRYNGPGSYFVLKRFDRDFGQTIHCKLKPMEPQEEDVDTILTGTNTNNQKMILKSDWLKSVFEDLDKSHQRITLNFSPNDPSLTLTAIGPTSKWESSYPQSSEPFINFECDRELTFSYQYDHIKLCKRALEHSIEVSIEVSLNGVLYLLEVAVQKIILNLHFYLLAPQQAK